MIDAVIVSAVIVSLASYLALVCYVAKAIAEDVREKRSGGDDDD